jgi:hypothetical protein
MSQACLKLVARELDRIIPRMIVSDNGTEFTSNVMLTWQKQQQIEWKDSLNIDRPQESA